jgi:hypothetical protein
MSTPGLTAIRPAPPHPSIRLAARGRVAEAHHDRDIAGDQALRLLDRDDAAVEEHFTVISGV